MTSLEKDNSKDTTRGELPPLLPPDERGLDMGAALARPDSTTTPSLVPRKPHGDELWPPLLPHDVRGLDMGANLAER